MANVESKRMKMSIMKDDINGKLGGDIVKVILSKLHIYNLPNCRIVCKAWNEAITDNKFKLDLDHDHHAFIVVSTDDVPHTGSKCLSISFMDLDTNRWRSSSCSVAATLAVGADWTDVRILSSCNGLLHLEITTLAFSANVIWNPMTNGFYQLPSILDNRALFGFGFAPNTSQYKVFRYLVRSNLSIIKIQVLTLRQARDLEWRRAFGPRPRPPFWLQHHGTYSHGHIYWISNKTPTTSKFLICALDVETETFETVATLDIGPNYPPEVFAYTQPFNDTVCVIIPCGNFMEVWVMKSKHVWIKEFVIDLPSPPPHFLHIIKASQDGAKLYFIRNVDLFCFDKTVGELTKINTLFHSNRSTYLGVAAHIRSFNFGILPRILGGHD